MRTPARMLGNYDKHLICSSALEIEQRADYFSIVLFFSSYVFVRSVSVEASSMNESSRRLIAEIVDETRWLVQLPLMMIFNR